jgi:hypothetical protein
MTMLPNVGRVHDAGAEVVGHHVRLGGEPLDEVERLRARQVQRERLLAGVGVIEQARGVGRGTAAADAVGPRGRLDAHHLGAEVGEDARPQRAGQHPGEVEDAQAGQRLCRIVAGRRRRRRRGAGPGRLAQHFVRVLAQPRRGRRRRVASEAR